jgi:hypothetical protein
MGRMKEEFMQMREQMQSQEINILSDIAQEYHSNNQSNLKNEKRKVRLVSKRDSKIKRNR